MPRSVPAVAPASFTRVGDLLKYLRRRAQLTQREVSIAVGYSEVHLSRFESNQYAPDVATLLALFVPAFDLEDEPEWVARLLELGTAAQNERQAPAAAPLATMTAAEARASLESVPIRPAHEIVRSQMLARVRERLHTGRGVALCALAGMGKTTLAAMLAREYAQTAPVFWLTLTQGVTTTVEAFIRQLALFLLVNGQTQVAAIVSRLPDTGEPLPLDQQLNLLGAALAAIAHTGQPLLCIDNVHLVQDDEAITAVLRHLLATTPALLLLMSREDIPLPEIVSLHLDGLKFLEGLELMARLGGNLYATLAERLLAKTGGSPMLLRLAIGQMRDQAVAPEIVIARLEREPHITVYLLDAMLQRLQAPALRLLALLAVFRQPLNLFDEQLLELSEAAGEGYDPAGTVAEIQRRHLIDHPARARMHPLVRDHVYATLATDLPRRRQLHCIAAEWSELVVDDSVEAAHHYACADDVPRAMAMLAEQSRLLRSRGQSFTAVEVVNDMLARVRRRADRDELARQLLVLRGDLLVSTLRAAEAEADYRAALERATLPGVRAQIMYRLADSLMQRGKSEEAVVLCQAIRRALAPTDTLLQAQLLIAESSAQRLLTEYDLAYQLAEAALPLIGGLATSVPSLAAELYAQAYSTMTKVMRLRQRYDLAREYSEQAIMFAHQAGLRQLEQRGRIELVYQLISQHDLEAVIALSEETMPLLYASNDHYAAARLLSATTLTYMDHGDVLTALRVATQGGDLSSKIGDAHGVRDANLRRGRVLIALGRIDEAQEIVERQIVQLAATGDMSFHAYYYDRLSMVHMVAGDVAAAEAALQHARTLRASSKEGKLIVDLDNDLAVVLLMRGATDQAAELVRADAMPGTSLASVLERELIRVLVLLARGDEAAAHEAAAAIATRADAAKHYHYSAAARRLLAAGIPPLSDLARLLWVEDGV